jgi:hypothetical protein
MIAVAGTHPLCKDCKHAANEGGPRYVCTKAQDIVTGYSPPCDMVRRDGLCGIEAKWFERRMNISAIVDQAPITTYVKDDGSVHPKPIAENSRVRAYRPQDINLDEWKPKSE